MDVTEFRKFFFVFIFGVNSLAQIVQSDSTQFCPEPPRPLRGYTDPCSISSDCVTNFCYQSKCACPSNTYYQDCKHSCVPNCDTNIPATSGDLVSHGYPFGYLNNQHCTWTLTGRPKTYFMMSFTDVDLEGYCGDDSVEIFNGPSPSSLRLAQFCSRNDTALKIVASSTNVIHIVFKTDGSIVYKGFSGSYRVYDNNARINQSDFGYIASPGYPMRYPGSSYFTWTIEGGQGKFISLSMLTLQLETESTCSFDYVQVYDGSSNHSMLLATVCSTSYPPVIMSSTSSLHIVFKTDNSNEYSGFAASYQINDCHSTLSNTSGYITSPGFPGQYENNLYCSWTIIAPFDQVIILRWFIVFKRRNPQKSNRKY